MTSAEIQRALIEALAEHQGADQFELAEAIDQAPFRVRAELKALKRMRLVREQISPSAHRWFLTARGWLERIEGGQAQPGGQTTPVGTASWS